jgi:LAO/AO transport system kinase
VTAPVVDAAALLAAARAGDRLAVARLLSLVERGGRGARDTARALAASPGSAGQAHVIGVTGAPGAGKSTLTSALVGAVRSTGASVAVLAIDPSSPYSGGAVLGDRVRMQEHATDDGVLIRSMATRGHLGGLSLAAPEAVRVLDAVGFPWIIIETVGVGQVEVEIAGRADTVVVVVNPGWGDAVQANKAGLLEIADIFVVNKADRPGAPETVRELAEMLHLTGRDTPVLSTVATAGEGAPALWEAVLEHRDRTVRTGAFADRRARRAGEELGRVLRVRLDERARRALGDERWAELGRLVERGELDPWSAVDELLGPEPD